MNLEYFLLFLIVTASSRACYKLSVATGYNQNADDVSDDVSKSKTILFLPLDERFTTRDAFINLARTTPYVVLTPPTSLLPSLKKTIDINELHKWVSKNIVRASTAIISSEMFLYGGLISSRCSNETTSTIRSRLEMLAAFPTTNRGLKLYVSNVVMRIPSYNGDFEEPWYWANYGKDIYSYSYYTDKYNKLNNPADKSEADRYKQQIPSTALDEFLWRRERNHNITMEMVNKMSPTSSSSMQSFELLFITLDDNAEYGFNIQEASEIKDLVQRLNVQPSVPIYPGADEVQMVQLARVAGIKTGKTVQFAVIFRAPEHIDSVPNYEGQPMISTLEQQINAAGGKMTIFSSSSNDIKFDPAVTNTLLLVNNFDTPTQLEASQQPSSGSSNSDNFDVFSPWIEQGLHYKTAIGFCDNRYSNGGDRAFVSYMNSKMSSSSSMMENMAYAGWNTNGNTIGTVVANSVMLTLFGGRGGSSATFIEGNKAFNSLRILEDVDYQAGTRQDLVTYVQGLSGAGGETSSNLQPDLTFYQRYSYKSLSVRYNEINQLYKLGGSFQLESIYYPWNRTFEIGFYLRE